MAKDPLETAIENILAKANGDALRAVLSYETGPARNKKIDLANPAEHGRLEQNATRGTAWFDLDGLSEANAKHCRVGFPTCTP